MCCWEFHRRAELAARKWEHRRPTTGASGASDEGAVRRVAGSAVDAGLIGELLCRAVSAVYPKAFRPEVGAPHAEKGDATVGILGVVPKFSQEQLTATELRSALVSNVWARRIISLHCEFWSRSRHGGHGKPPTRRIIGAWPKFRWRFFWVIVPTAARWGCVVLCCADVRIMQVICPTCQNVFA
jgi:hypothetical protein